MYILYYIFCQIKQVPSFNARYAKKRDFPPKRGNVNTYDVTSHTCGPGCQFDNGTSLWAAVLWAFVLGIDGEDILGVWL